MADHCAVTIPLEKIDRIQIYINAARKSLSAIRAETGADYILNGTLFNMSTFEPNCHLKAEGEVLCRPPYAVAGYAWQTGPDISMDTLPDDGQNNYIACTPLIVSGAPLNSLTYDVGQGGERGRSAIGIKDGRLALYCTRDGGSMARTPEQLREDLAAAGWDSAVMLDGGGSAQCDFSGQTVVSGRTVHDLILVFLKKEANVSGTANDILDIARGELGYKESPANSNKTKYGAWYGLDGCAWCVMFVQWVFHQGGVPLPLKTASCTQLMNAAKKAGCWVSGPYQSGDVVIYDWGDDKVPDHCGIVEAVSGKTVTTIEGNTSASNDSDGGQVMRRDRSMSQILGAVRPTYKEDEKMDNSPANAYKEGVEWCQENGILLGNTDGDLMLSQPVTREQMCTFLYRLAKLMGKA